jgi:ribonuclease P protein component
LRRAAGKGATNSHASSGQPPRASAASGPPGSGGQVEARRRGRLTRRAEFDAVYRNGRRRSSRQFTVFFASNGLAESRFGMSAGRALGGAVVRNRIRRRVREILRLDREEIPSGWDIIVHPRASVAAADFALLRREFLALLRNSIPASSVPLSGEQSPGGRAPNPEATS